MDDGIPDDFDVIVIGTGLPESILASACARVGLTVLHIDSNDYYGDSWASFNLEQLIKWVDDNKNTRESSIPEIDVQIASHEKLLLVTKRSKTFSNVDFQWLAPLESVPEEPKIEPAHCKIESENPTESSSNVCTDEPEHQILVEEQKWTKGKILNDWRRFCIDLAPKVLLSRGDMVNLLVESNVGRYAEFKNVDRILTYLNGSLKIVPCSRSDVFQSNEINMVEKRMLMKFLTFCLNYEQNIADWQDYRDKSFESFLNGQNLTPLIRHYILNALAMVSSDCSTEEGLRSVNEFLMSTGRYGSSPFLWTVYGSGELPQCFSRLCAVFGGVYCLRCDVQAFIVAQNERKISAVVINGRRITCRHLITNATYLPKDLTLNANEVEDRLSRAVLITDRSLIPDGPNHISLLNVRFPHLSEPVKILELGHGGMVCPKDLCIVHLTTSAKTNVEHDLGPVIGTFFALNDSDLGVSDRPMVLARLYFNHAGSNIESDEAKTELPSNLIVTELADNNFNYDSLVKKVRSLFQTHFPDTPFLEPREDPVDEGVVEANDPGINGFTPDPEPQHQQTRPIPVEVPSVTTEEDVENKPLPI